ncbi:hypothetical protein [Falsihalocynthiibacter arcticus]|uniref:Uncharacterized protein n=1 Tax=Falsihalocynthiibacter arcticus TaxID=1579316 RepID=A0A126V688_9RHOB|nr:hypothetical protein [Falsihalocynthiibacter arcticus]AML53219.1 hypothetical protein RC74_19910 [Falsihalocynthiibacter arcticus]
MEDVVGAERPRLLVFLGAAGVTLLASHIAVKGVVAGIENQQKMAAEARRRRFAAARAFLPPALSQIYATCDVALLELLAGNPNRLENVLKPAVDREPRDQKWKKLELVTAISEEARTTLRETLEVTDDPKFHKLLVEIIREHQIARSSLLDLTMPGNGVHFEFGRNRELLVMWIYLQLLVGIALDFSRSDSELFTIVEDEQDFIGIMKFRITNFLSKHKEDNGVPAKTPEEVERLFRSELGIYSRALVREFQT